MKRLLAVLVAAIFAALLTVAPSGAAGGGVQRTSVVSEAQGTVLAESDYTTVRRNGDWVTNTYGRDLPGAEVASWQGNRITLGNGQTGCRYSRDDQEGVDTPIPVGYVQVEREVAHNLVACQMRVESALITTTLARELGIRVDDNGANDATMTASSVGLAPNATTKGRYQKLYYEDPLWIDVTSVTVRVRWTYTGSCTTSSQHSSSWDEYGTTGWERTAQWWGYDLASCAYGATTSNTSTHKNEPFCDVIVGFPMPTTWNQYHTNYIQGKSDGSVYYEWWAQKWGGCAQLLSFHRVIGSWSGF